MTLIFAALALLRIAAGTDCAFVDQCDASRCLLIVTPGDYLVVVPQSWLGKDGHEGAHVGSHEGGECDEIGRVRDCRNDDKAGRPHGARWCDDVDTREPVRLAWPVSGVVRL